jgi:hypothetical protein
MAPPGPVWREAARGGHGPSPRTLSHGPPRRHSGDDRRIQPSVCAGRGNLYISYFFHSLFSPTLEIPPPLRAAFRLPHSSREGIFLDAGDGEKVNRKHLAGLAIC